MRSTPMCHLISNISLTLSSIWRIVFLFLCVFIILFTIYNRISSKSPLLFLTFCQLFLPRLKAKYFKNIISRFLQVLSQFFALGSFMNLPSDAPGIQKRVFIDQQHPAVARIMTLWGFEGNASNTKWDTDSFSVQYIYYEM